MSSNTAFLKGPDAVRKMGSIGRPAINVEARVVDPEGNDVAPGEVGEIVYRGPTVMRGYFGKEEASAEAFAGGWFHSGDLVREDDEGFLYVVDRLKDMLISGGENVYPAEVEAVLAAHPAVAEAAVVGVPDERWGEVCAAFVVLRDQVGDGELADFCRARLARFKVPKSFHMVESLPRNALGKVQKSELKVTV
jgi:acyl-CoA synthetase (AMP-forming)/AMP-acid ligase II